MRYCIRWTAAAVFLAAVWTVRLAAQEPAVAADSAASAAVPEALRTTAERTDYVQTSTYEDVQRLCDELAKRSERIQRVSLGRSAQGRDLPLLIVADPPLKNARQARKSGKLVVLVLGNIHAGEVCGKEASLVLARRLGLETSVPLLDKLIVLLAPIYNADGNEHISTAHRPNQSGPEGGVGQRANADGLDLNRDHIKLESSEGRCLVRCLNAWDPVMVIDTHTTNGSHHQYTLTYDGPRHPATPGNIVEFMRDDFLPQAAKRMHERSGYRGFFYGNFNADHTQWRTYPAQPRFGTQYVGLRGRLGVLSEAYAYASFRDRVLATQHFVHACLSLCAERADEISQLVNTARAQWTSAPAEPMQVAVRSSPVPLDESFDVLGYVEQQRDGRRVATEQEQTYTVQVLGQEEPTVTVARPWAYLIPPDLTGVIKNLRRHGIQLETLREDLELDVQSFRIDNWSQAERAYQGHHLVDIQVTPVNRQQRLVAGTIVARTAQPLGALLVNLLEPESSDGLVTWNFFDASLSAQSWFPVARLLDAQPLLTSDYNPSRPRPATKRKPITFETLFGKHPVRFGGSPAAGFRWFPDGEHYLVFRDGKHYKVHAATGQSSMYVDQQKLTTALEALPGISRESAEKFSEGKLSRLNHDLTATVWEHHGDLYFAQLDGAEARRLTSTPGDEELVSFSPTGDRVAFVREFDLYTVDIRTGKEQRLTVDGDHLRRHGKADWVYFEEVYNRSWQGYRWSPDGTQIAFLEFDDTPVHDFTVLNHLPHRLDVEIERYPKSGDPIPQVRLGIVLSAGGSVRWIALDGYSRDNMILTRYGWTPDSRALFAYVQDRTQRWLDVLRISADTGQVTHLFRERGKTWVPDPGDLQFLNDGSFVIRSDRNGWRHLYCYSKEGKLRQALTDGPWEVREVLAADEDDDGIYFTGTRDSPIAVNVYRVKADGSQTVRLTPDDGSHRVSLSPRRQLLIDTFSSHARPTQVVLRDHEGAVVRTLDTNPIPALTQYRFGTLKMMTIDAKGGFAMPASMLLPPDFDATQPYPVWMRVYAGPHNPAVRDAWRSGHAYDQMLAQLGMIVVHVDPQSASGQGPRSAWKAYRKLGIPELRDLEQAVDWLAALPYVDGNRIGISGHSYGGFMTAFALTHSKRFAAGVSGAPVTDWRNYDAFYTERYMSTPQDNPEGYRNTSVVRAAKNLHGKLLLIHGAQDDNVHLQNTLQLVHALQKADKDFELMIYPTSRHGIHGKHYQRLIVDFIRRAILDQRPESPSQPAPPQPASPHPDFQEATSP